MHIGEMNYRNQGNQTAVIGIKICEFEFQKKGLGKTVLSMLIKDLFSSGYRKIILDTNINNKLAQHVYEKLGFQKVSVNTDARKDQQGNFQSSVDYELYEETLVDFM
jgi:RimJ/RimL family protein N-acetyltransferase